MRSNNSEVVAPPLSEGNLRRLLRQWGHHLLLTLFQRVAGDILTLQNRV